MNSGDATFLMNLYERAILPQFDIQNNISWDKNEQTFQNGRARFFKSDDLSYMLVFEDYPTLSVDDVRDISGVNGSIIPIRLRDDPTETHLSFGPRSTPYKYVDGITGYFSLYRYENVR